jgi:hypothetical protein
VKRARIGQAEEKTVKVEKIGEKWRETEGVVVATRRGGEDM